MHARSTLDRPIFANDVRKHQITCLNWITAVVVKRCFYLHRSGLGLIFFDTGLAIGMLPWLVLVISYCSKLACDAPYSFKAETQSIVQQVNLDDIKR